MPLDYEYYGNYDSDCGDEIDMEGQIRDWLGSLDWMLKFVSNEKPEILNSFASKVASKYQDEIGTDPYVLNDVGFERLLEDQSVLGNHEKLKDFGLQLIMKYIPFNEGYTLSNDKTPIRWFDYCQAKYLLVYYGIASLVEILGREEGIQLYKEFVEYRAKEYAKKGTIDFPFKDARKERVKSWSQGGMKFGVVDFDEHMYLAKFDKCISHESMKHVDDQELAYYAVCYPAPRIMKHLMGNIRLRRSVTLFSGNFCDELRWDPNVHDEPEQPSHELSKKIVPKKN